MNKLHYIDSLRGVAILMVLFNHTCESISNLPKIIADVGYYGKYGVQLFFVMSAYTLCLSMHNRNKETSLINYFIRRFFRIAPLYYSGIIIYFVMYYIDTTYSFKTFLPYHHYGAKELVTNITFTHGLLSDTFNALVLGGWSIGTEMAFYLVFPFLFFMFTKIENKYVLILTPLLSAIVISVFFRALPHIFPPISNHNFEFYYCSLLNQLPVFLVGISLFFYSINFSINKLVTNYSFVFFIGMTVILIVLLSNNYLRDITIYTFLVALSFLFLFFVFKNSQLFNFKFLQKIGQLSYSIYIVHFLFAWGFSSYINEWLSPTINSTIILCIAFFASFLLSFGLSLITNYVIESPGIKLGSKLISKLK
jgi:peptidoglycan/LPS O-acetylase OafA/YrhL